jgi:hypothetical protein
MRKIALLLITIILLASCASMTDNVVQSVDDEAFQETDLLYDEMVRSFLGLPSEMSKEELEKKLTLFLEVESYNKDYQARIFGLNALWNQIEGKKIKAKSFLEEVEATGRLDELIYITQSLDGDNSVILLEKGKEELYMTRYLPLFLGEAYYKAGSFGKGATSYEQISSDLPMDIQEYAHKKMEDCLTLYQNGSTSSDEADLFTQETLILQDFLTFFHSQTQFSDSLKGQTKEETFINWQSEKILAPEDTEDILLLRRKLARILMGLSLYMENENQTEEVLLFDQMGESPIADVSLGDPDFPAILLVIEREWINMINGEDFDPNGIVKGKDLIPLFNKLNDYYSRQVD